MVILVNQLTASILWQSLVLDMNYCCCFQEQVTAAITLAMEQQTQKLLAESQLDMGEFENLLLPIIDTCTKDAISVCEMSMLYD